MPTSSAWAVASPHRTANAAASDVLRRGGNAVDAALAAAVVLAVAYPHQCSVGGDLIALVGTPECVVAIDGSGRSPRAASPDGLAEMPIHGAHTVTVPGAPAAWFELARRWGSLSLAEALTGAADLASDGVPVAPGLARALDREADRLRADAGLREVFLRDGAVLAEGQALVQHRLAQTLRDLAGSGPDAFYAGAAESIVATLRARGSAMTPADFAEHRTSTSEPLAASLAGVEYLTAPPACQGAFFLEGLAALDIVRQQLGRELDPIGEDAALVALVTDAAARDRDALLGDPASTTVDVAALLSTRARQVARDALAGRALPARPGVRPTGDTVAVVTTDAHGNWVSLMQSTYFAFGSGILDPASGVVLHNRGAAFSLEPGPNRFAGGRKPAHTLMPVLVRHDGELVGAHGTMGGRAQPQIHTQLALHLANGAPPEIAVRRPRWVLEPRRSGSDPAMRTTVAVEDDLPEAARRRLARHFAITRLPALDDEVGHAQVVRRTDDGLVAASDPRADGAATA
jgi:gamma-glutamyltranspeptidase/glutathione hydrolase